jgi:hypothetical protein
MNMTSKAESLDVAVRQAIKTEEDLEGRLLASRPDLGRKLMTVPWQAFPMLLTAALLFFANAYVADHYRGYIEGPALLLQFFSLATAFMLALYPSALIVVQRERRRQQLALLGHIDHLSARLAKSVAEYDKARNDYMRVLRELEKIPDEPHSSGDAG